RKAAARAEKISRQAAVMARNVESPERLLGQMEPLIEDAQSTRDPIDLLVMLVCSAGLERRRGAFDHNMVELVTELHAVDLVTQAIAVSRELAASLPTWRGLATKAFGGAFKSDLCTLESIRLEAQVSFRASPASARERYLAYAPAGTIAEELGSHWGPLVAQEEDTSGAADETSTLVGMGIKSQSKELIDAAARRLGLQEPALG
ncbi:MAG: hypothetical protein AAF679_01200, partial [Pseudomonadota bacterium]